MAAKPYAEISRCRICGGEDLVEILSLGRQALTGVFPRSRDAAVTAGPLELVKCRESRGGERCGLVQLRQSYRLEEMYGEGYGYHSGLNPSMVRHLHRKVAAILKTVPVKAGDLVLDIGSNDGTLLRAYPARGLTVVGMDPTGEKFRKYYPAHAELIPDFFSAKKVLERYGGRKAKIVTSIAMFYDLERPLDFVRQVREVLADDGVWVMEQSYLPTMLKMTAYDTICHEHLEYYGLRQIRWMAERAGLKILGAETNAVNGGSFSVMLAKAVAPYRPRAAQVAGLLAREKTLLGMKPFNDFSARVNKNKRDILAFLAQARKAKMSVIGYGASTKGNVILQYCGLTAAQIPVIGEVNEDKFGCFTPGTRIPIVPESEAKAARPDCLMVLPWHFKDFIVKKEAAYLKAGGKLFFPLPRPHVVG